MHKFVVALLVSASLVAAVAVVYALSAYAFVPSVWRFVERRHPALQEAGTRSFTSAGIPGDPLNIAFVGTEQQLQSLMAAAHWHPADAITLKSSLRIAVDSVAHKAYADAPVSSLFVRGHKQDLAFEAPAGRDPSKRHHVRFWKMPTPDNLGRPLWIGAVTYDAGVGVSHTTGQITHHIDGDIDAERNHFVADVRTGQSVQVDWINDFQVQREGRNGGGDKYFTDGRLALITVDAPANALQTLNGWMGGHLPFISTTNKPIEATQPAASAAAAPASTAVPALTDGVAVPASGPSAQ